MAVFGIGSMYGSTEEKLPEFKKHGCAFVGYKLAEAPFIHQMMKSIKIGDIIFVKSFSGPHGLFIKGVGIVTSIDFIEDNLGGLGFGIPVKWFWICDPDNDDDKIKIGKLGDKGDNMRGGTLYEEYNPEVKLRLIEILSNGVK